MLQHFSHYAIYVKRIQPAEYVTTKEIYFIWYNFIRVFIISLQGYKNNMCVRA
jgi:hypothetical protein